MPQPQPREVGSVPEGRASARFESIYQGLLAEFDGEPLSVSFRQLAGPLPADEHTHGLYPYPARLLRHIPRMLLQTPSFTEENTLVVDPFCGSGTVLVEAQHAGMQSVGYDVNPLAALVSRVKTTFVPKSRVLAGASQVREAAVLLRREGVREELARWYSAPTASVLGRIARSIGRVEDDQVKAVLMVGLALTARRSSLADPRIPVPVLDGNRTRLSAAATWNVWETTIARLSERVARRSGLPQAHVEVRDARTANYSDFSDFVVFSSPPYGAAQKYSRATWLESAWLGLARSPAEIEHTSVGREHIRASDREPDTSGLPTTIADVLTELRATDVTRASIYENYFLDMRNALHALSTNRNLVRMGLVLGTNQVSGRELLTHQHVVEIARSLGFQETLALADEIRGRTLLTRRHRGAAPARSEFIYVLERRT